jgi:hypothetical protein
MEPINITELVKNNTTSFAHYRNQHVYYSVFYRGDTYVYPITVDPTDEAYDLGNATLQHTEKAMTMMRYMRKAIAAGTFTKA